MAAVPPDTWGELLAEAAGVEDSNGHDSDDFDDYDNNDNYNFDNLSDDSGNNSADRVVIDNAPANFAPIIYDDLEDSSDDNDRWENTLVGTPDDYTIAREISDC